MLKNTDSKKKNRLFWRFFAGVIKMRDLKNSFISDVKKSADIVEREQRTILNKFHSSGFISSSAINEIAQVYLLAQQKLKNEILAFECFIEISKRLGFHSVSNNDFIVLSNNYFYNTHFEDVLTLLQNIAEQLQSLKKSKMPRKQRL